MEYSIRTKSNAMKVELNDRKDYIAIHPDNANLPRDFANGREKMLALVEDFPKRIEAINKEYEGRDDEKSTDEKEKKIYEERASLAEHFVESIDGIFGEGTIRKYFADNYEQVHNFLPGENCVIDFFNEITPVIEQIFGKYIKRVNAAMAKYQPQDHKRKSDK